MMTSSGKCSRVHMFMSGRLPCFQLTSFMRKWDTGWRDTEHLYSVVLSNRAQERHLGFSLNSTLLWLHLNSTVTNSTKHLTKWHDWSIIHVKCANEVNSTIRFVSADRSNTTDAWPTQKHDISRFQKKDSLKTGDKGCDMRQSHSKCHVPVTNH